MKKLALIVLLAVVASHFFRSREAHHRIHRAVRDTPIHSVFFADDEAWTTRTEPAPFAPPPPPHPPAPPRAREKGKRRGPHEARAELASRAEPTPPTVPSWFPRSEADEERLARPDPAGIRVLVGPISISSTRARTDLQKVVSHKVADWLAADVPMTWTPPADLVDRMVLGSYVRQVVRDVGPSQAEPAADAAPSREELADLDDVYTFHVAGQRLDFSERRRDEFVERYHRDVASGRMRRLGSILAVVLAGLAVVSLYVRTDEATRGYYTNRLRALALVSLTTAGFVAHHYWA